MLLCEALGSVREGAVIAAFACLFAGRGLPDAIRTDNGVPIASPNALFNVSTVLAGQKLGLKEVDDGIWLISFMHYDLGYIDLEQKTLLLIDNPFGKRLSSMFPGRTRENLERAKGLEPSTPTLATCPRGLRQGIRWFAMLR